MLYIIRVMNTLLLGSHSVVLHSPIYEGISLLLFPALDLTEKWAAVHLICQGDQVCLPRSSSPSLTLPPPLCSLIGRDSHHMCKGKVMGGMAALISERLPADKANGCGEA